MTAYDTFAVFAAEFHRQFGSLFSTLPEELDERDMAMCRENNQDDGGYPWLTPMRWRADKAEPGPWPWLQPLPPGTRNRP